MPLYVLTKGLYFNTDYGVIHVPARYKTDFASIPWWARWIYKVKDDRYAHAAILHDFLFEFQGGRKLLPEYWGINSYIDFDDCNKLLRDYAIMGGTPKWKAKLMKFMVQNFGLKIWRSHNDDLP